MRTAGGHNMHEQFRSELPGLLQSRPRGASFLRGQDQQSDIQPACSLCTPAAASIAARLLYASSTSDAGAGATSGWGLVSEAHTRRMSTCHGKVAPPPPPVQTLWDFKRHGRDSERVHCTPVCRRRDVSQARTHSGRKSEWAGCV